MVRKNKKIPIVSKEQLLGGAGVTDVQYLLSSEELNDKGRLFASFSIEPGGSVGFHTHDGESEIFYIVSGKARYKDDISEYVIEPGDVTITSSGEGHSIENIGDCPLHYIGVVIFK